MSESLRSILEAVRGPFGLGPSATVAPLGNGHINTTCLVSEGDRHLVAQRINTAVFGDPGMLVRNARRIEAHLQGREGAIPAVRHLPGQDGRFLHGPAGDVRVLEYFPGSRSIEVLETPAQGEMASSSFARFSRALSDFDPAALETVIPNFHSPGLRWRQFETALAADCEGRSAACEQETGFVLAREGLVGAWQALMGELPVRVCHNDCKINNLLVHGDDGSPVAIIDLDTCMPGPLLTDFGDLVRTCCSPEAEDSTRLEAVRARPEVYAALVRGYVDGWRGEITGAERRSLLEGGLLMCFLIGLRFLTDFLDGDRYFAVSRPAHNLERARNQFRLFSSLESQRNELEKLA